MKLCDYGIKVAIYSNFIDACDFFGYPYQVTNMYQRIHQRWNLHQGQAYMIVYKNGVQSSRSAIPFFRHHGYTNSYVDNMIRSVARNIKT